MPDQLDIAPPDVRPKRLRKPRINLGKRRGIREKSHSFLFGLRLYEIALGPEPKLGQPHGHARAFLAIGDVATGVIAIGGVARGVLAIGGVAVGGIALGGCSLGLLLGLGGLAAGGVALGGVAAGIIAAGGAACGLVAIGGVAVGYYASGGAAYGTYVADAVRQHPEAIRFFNEWLPAFGRFLQHTNR